MEKFCVTQGCHLTCGNKCLLHSSDIEAPSQNALSPQYAMKCDPLPDGSFQTPKFALSIALWHWLSNFASIIFRTFERTFAQCLQRFLKDSIGFRMCVAGSPHHVARLALLALRLQPHLIARRTLTRYGFMLRIRQFDSYVCKVTRQMPTR